MIIQDTSTPIRIYDFNVPNELNDPNDPNVLNEIDQMNQINQINNKLSLQQRPLGLSL